MYISIRKYQLDPASLEEVVRKVAEDFVPIISDASEFSAYYTLKSGDGVLVTVSVFEDRTGAVKSNEIASEYVRENLASLIAKPPEISSGEVGVHEVGSKEREQGSYATIRKYQINQGAVHEALRQFNEGIASSLKEQSGFVEYYGLEGESEIAAVNIFEERAEAEESNRIAGDYVEKNLSSLLPLPPEITSGETVVSQAK
jgi:hypothetical protein